MLVDRGFVRVRPLLGGIDAWADAGFALEQFE
jgi:rhodanese-related sulfurtransferase